MQSMIIFFRNEWRRFQWDSLCFCHERYEAARARWLKHRFNSPEAQRVYETELLPVRRRLHALARSLGMSEAVADLPMPPNYGRYPSIPRWLLVH